MNCFLTENLEELRKIYPKIVAIVNDWQQLAKIHGLVQTESEKKILKKYVIILKKLGVIAEGKNK